MSDSVPVLLQLQALCGTQMQDIKRDEASWLQMSFVFYGAALAWLIKLLEPAAQGSVASPASAAVLQAASPAWAEMLQALSWCALGVTVLFTLLFAHTRHSYYGVLRRLMRIQRELKLDVPKRKGGLQIFPEPSAAETGLSAWWKLTKPHGSALTRVLLVCGANIGVLYLARHCLVRLVPQAGLPPEGVWPPYWASPGLLVLYYGYDYTHFRLKPLRPDSSSSSHV